MFIAEVIVLSVQAPLEAESEYVASKGAYLSISPTNYKHAAPTELHL